MDGRWDVRSAFFYGFILDEAKFKDVKWVIYNPGEMPDWEAEYQERTGESAEDSPCTIESYSEYGWSIYCITFRGMFWRYSPADSKSTEIDVSTVTTKTKKYRDQIEAFCELMGLPFREPAWHLSH